MHTLSRRHLLCAMGGAALLRGRLHAAGDPWSALPGILARIQPPQFPERAFDITRYGAKEGGSIDNTEAFRKAIDAAAAAGGGSVTVPQGVFLTGAIHLKSNIHLVVPKGATVKFNPDTRLYPIVLTRFEGLECMNWSPFIYALDASNIAITGGGTLDGQAGCDHWWPWSGKAGCGTSPGNQRKARAALGEMAEKGVPVEQRVFGEGGYLRPMFIQPYRCSNILIADVTITNSPMYEMHPVLCRNFTARNVTVSSHGPNNDGCDPESSVDVLLDGCTFDTGDDCIAIKSGRNADGRRINRPSENIVVRSCNMKDGHGGVTMGSECSGHIRNVFAYDCRMDSPNLDRVLRFKDNAMRGGIIEHVYMRNVKVGQVARAALDVDFYYEEAARGGFTPIVRDVEMENVAVGKCQNAWSLRGFSNAPIRDIRLKNCTFNNAERPSVAEHVEGLTLDNVTVNGKKVE
ncbi:MAG: glycoside hydrolase family 28 protein [Acidobacteriota bacterium]|nr:glycoside hydrolase family 28 protein [Acidobacteriota bacterium]